MFSRRYMASSPQTNSELVCSVRQHSFVVGVQPTDIALDIAGVSHAVSVIITARSID